MEKEDEDKGKESPASGPPSVVSNRYSGGDAEARQAATHALSLAALLAQQARLLKVGAAALGGAVPDRSSVRTRNSPKFR